MENEPCKRSSALQELFNWKSAGGRPDVSPSKKRTPWLSLSRFLKLGATPKELLALTSGRV